MAPQSKEDCPVPEGPRKEAPTRGVEHLGGGKAVPVNEQARQLLLPFATAENLKARAGRAAAAAGADLSAQAERGAPKAKGKGRIAAPATMEGIVERLRDAFERVASNKGAPGPDGQTIAMVAEDLDEVLPVLSDMLLEGTFEPGDIRRVWIPKGGGGQRGLGIPDVIDRMVQEAVRQVLEPLYEPTFHPSSHGFRPGRSCHTAIAQARSYLEDGYEYVVDLDLEKFFDRVCHQRLLARLAQRVTDRRLLVLIGRMLRAKVVMPDGVRLDVAEGVPQGGPLSPLLSNIVLDEFDQELARRGHRFVRYADDSNIYVRSKRAGHRVMASVTRFIERKLRLSVNVAKSAVARPEERHFLGFTLEPDSRDGSVRVKLSERSKERLKQNVRELTPRNWGNSLKSCILRVNAYIRGWFNFFGICSASEERLMSSTDAHIRRRLRAIQLKHWKRKSTIARKLIALGVNRRTAWRRVYEGRKSLWALSHDPAVDRGLRNAYFAKRGLVSLAELARKKLQAIVAPRQQPLPF